MEPLDELLSFGKCRGAGLNDGDGNKVGLAQLIACNGHHAGIGSGRGNFLELLIGGFLGTPAHGTGESRWFDSRDFFRSGSAVSQTVGSRRCSDATEELIDLEVFRSVQALALKRSDGTFKSPQQL
jgi:hypothetical protein